MIKKMVYLTVLFLTNGFIANAQVSLDLNQAVSYALQHKAEAVKARLDVRNSEYKIEEVRASALPQINASSGLTYNALIQKTALNLNGQTMVIKMGQPWQNTAAVQLDQQIFNMSVFQGLKAAKTTREFYAINAELTDEQIIEKVASNYYEVYKIKDQIKTMDNTINNTTRVKNVLDGLYQAGLAKKIDLDRIQVALNNLQSAKQQLVNGLSLQENALKYLIGMDIQTEIVMPEHNFEINQALAVEKPQGIEHRTEIKLLTQQEILLNLNKKAIEAQRYPTLSFTANYGYLGIGEQMPWFAGIEQGVNWSNFSAIGLNLRVPIFTGFSNRAKVQQAEIDLMKFSTDVADTKLALSLAAENAYAQIQNALITLNMQSSNRQLAKDVLDNIEQNYKNGLAPLTDLLDAETSYADAQNNYTNALLNYKQAEIQLIKAKGELKSYFNK